MKEKKNNIFFIETITPFSYLKLLKSKPFKNLIRINFKWFIYKTYLLNTLSFKPVFFINIKRKSNSREYLSTFYYIEPNLRKLWSIKLI